MLPVGKDQIRSSDRTTGFLALESAYAEQQHLSWLCVLFLSSPEQVCAPSTQMGEAQEAEDEGASPRPRRYPRSRYRPDGARRRTAGELRARGARNQWPPSTSQNKRGADNRSGASKRGTALSPCNLVLKPTSGNTEVRARTSVETTAGEIGTADPGMARLAGKRNGSGPGNTESRDRQPTHWGGRSSRVHYFGRADSARDRQPCQGYRGAAHPATGRRTATPGSQPSRSQHAAGTTKAARLTAEETTPRAEPRQGNEKATGAVPVVQVVDEPAGAPGSRTSAPSAPKTAPNRPALKSRAEPATQAPQAMQRAGSKPPQPKHVCQKKWALLEDLHKANSKGATDLLYDYLGGGSFKQRRTDFHKLECCKGIPCVGNWTVAMFAHLLAGTTLNSTKQAKVYGDAVEGWISDIASEPEFEELTGHIAEGLTLRKSWSPTKGSRPRPRNPALWHSSRAGTDHRPRKRQLLHGGVGGGGGGADGLYPAPMPAGL